MMAKYVAPDHVTSVFLSCGEYAVVEGVAELPDELSYGDAIGLAANGFVEDTTPRSSRAQSRDVAQRISTALDTNGVVGDA
jgi:uncharacterized protein with GYD domain